MRQLNAGELLASNGWTYPPASTRSAGLCPRYQRVYGSACQKPMTGLTRSFVTVTQLLPMQIASLCPVAKPPLWRCPVYANLAASAFPLSAIKNMPTVGDRLDTKLFQSAQSTPMPRAMNAG